MPRLALSDVKLNHATPWPSVDLNNHICINICILLQTSSYQTHLAYTNKKYRCNLQQCKRMLTLADFMFKRWRAKCCLGQARACTKMVPHQGWTYLVTWQPKPSDVHYSKQYWSEGTREGGRMWPQAALDHRDDVRFVLLCIALGIKACIVVKSVAFLQYNVYNFLTMCVRVKYLQPKLTKINAS